MKKRLFTLVLIFIMLSLFSVPAFADAAYKTVTTDKNGNYIETQTAYKPVNTIEKIGDELLSGPADMVIKDECLYIADSGNARVTVSSLSGELISIIGLGILKDPRGVFVTEQNEVYVADASGAVFRFAPSGELIKTYTKPQEPLYGEKETFVPVKVAADSKDNLYVVCKGNGNGVVQLSSKTGEFLGYFGANEVSKGLWDRFLDAIFTDEQKSQLKQATPASISNIAVDGKGIVYTMTDIKTEQVIRKLNMSGNDMLEENISFSNPSDLAIGSTGNIYAAATNGYLLEFSSEGDLLFAFGGFDDGSQRIGLFNSISSLCLDKQGCIYVLDDTAGQIQVFAPTEFTDYVHTALDLYSQGKYSESKEPWEKVLLMNNLFDYAHRGIAQAYYMQGNYKAAMQEFRLSNDKAGYSEAFREQRNIGIRNNIVLILVITVALIGGIALLLYFRKKRKQKEETPLKKRGLFKEITYIFSVPKNPFDAYYGIKREHKVSVLSSTVLYGIFVVIYLADKYLRGYIFSSVTDGKYSLFKDSAVIIGILLLFNLAFYLICSVTEGEASVKNTYCGIIYSLMPYLVLRPLVIILSHILSDSEVFIINMLNFVIWAGCIILLVIMVSQLNNYKNSEVVKCIFWTLFSVAISIAVLFILYVMSKQTVGVLAEIWNEVSYNAQN